MIKEGKDILLKMTKMDKVPALLSVVKENNKIVIIIKPCDLGPNSELAEIIFPPVKIVLEEDI